MKLLHDFADHGAYRGGFVSIGNFDGVHRGHQAMIAKLVERAHAAEAPAVVLTFNPHPIQLLRPNETPPSLSTLGRKARLLGECGVDCVIAYPTNLEFLKLSAEEFFERIVLHELEARGLVEGPNFFFGRDRAGNVERLRAFCEEAELSLDIVAPVAIDGLLVSSSEVRRYLLAGDVERAARLLGRNYQASGIVGHGAVRGRSLGFPTANLQQIETLLPLDGVYAGVARPDGTPHAAAIHVGPNPTFGEAQRKVEAHLIGYEGNLYEAELEVEFLARIRPTMTFADVGQLQAQLEKDVERVKAVAGQVLSR